MSETLIRSSTPTWTAPTPAVYVNESPSPVLPKKIKKSTNPFLSLTSDSSQLVQADQNVVVKIELPEREQRAKQPIESIRPAGNENGLTKSQSQEYKTFRPDNGVRARLFRLRTSISDLRNAVYIGLGLDKQVNACIRVQQRVLTRGEWLVMFLCLGLTIGISVAAVVERNPVIPRQASSAGFMLTIYLAAHNSVLDLLLGVPFERRLFWHKLIAILATWLGLLHGALAILKWPGCLSTQLSSALLKQTFVSLNITEFCPDDCLDYDYRFKILKTCVPYRVLMMISGLVLTGFLLLILITSIPAVLRRKKFGFFHFFHLTFTVGVTLAAIAHHSWLVIIIAYQGIALLLIDMFTRYVYKACTKHPKIAAITALPGDVTRITLDRPANFHYIPGQYVFINVPKVSKVEWHPFTISSSPHTKIITLHIQALGDWSKKLREFAESHNKNFGIQTTTTIPLGVRPVYYAEKRHAEVSVFMEGPYGESKIDFNAYKVYVLVSGNIGVTPMQALGNFLLHQAKKTERQLVKVYFIWCVSDPAMVNSLFEADRSVDAGPLSDWSTSDDGKQNKHLHSEIYLTRSKTVADAEVQNAVLPAGIMRCIKFGRPNWPQIFSSIEGTAREYKEKNVAVYACGNSNLVDQINDYCDYRNKFHKRSAKRSAQHHRLRFDVNLEEFDW